MLVSNNKQKLRNPYAAYSSMDGILYDKLKTTLILYPQSKLGSSFIIPNGVTSIENYAFDYCSRLTSVTIPNSVTSIGWNAFNECTSLTEAKFFGNAPTVMEDDVFLNCASNFKIYYLYGKTGFTNPWYEYPTEPFYAGTYTVTYNGNGSNRGTTPSDCNGNNKCDFIC